MAIFLNKKNADSVKMSGFQLFIESIKSDSDEEIIKKFKSKYLEKTDKDSWRPLHHACRYGRLELVKLLLSNHCEVNSRANDGYQPIHWACKNGYINIVKELLRNKPDINASEKKHRPKRLSIWNGVIANKCDINASDDNGYQPIHLACENGHIDVVKILIAHKCNKNALTKNGESPIDIAKKKGHQEIIDVLNMPDPTEMIAKAMELDCGIDCNHEFCRKSFEDGTFKKGELIGSGIFAKVFKCKISNTKREIVIKQTKSDYENKKNIEGNINKFASQIMHENIIRYFGAVEKADKLCIYLEYMPGGSLKELIEKSNDIEHSKVIKFSKQILNGLQFLHSQRIIHRDIKPEHMLLDNDETLKLIDFGLSKLMSVGSDLETTVKTKTFCGTPNFLAPEVFLGEPYDYLVDVWSLGASIINMITGKIPYHWLDPNAVMFRIGTVKKIEFTPCKPISETMQSFINDLLTSEQSNRPSAELLLKHSIFRDVK